MAPIFVIFSKDSHDELAYMIKEILVKVKILIAFKSCFQSNIFGKKLGIINIVQFCLVVGLFSCLQLALVIDLPSQAGELVITHF